jgi:hypothetical protein
MPLECCVWDLTVAPVPMYNGIRICGHATLAIYLIMLIGDCCPPTALAPIAACAAKRAGEKDTNQCRSEPGNQNVFHVVVSMASCHAWKPRTAVRCSSAVV